MTSREDQKLCGVKTQAGPPCKHYAGFRTLHPGFGRCYRHGGSNPSGRTAAAKEVVAEVIRAVEERRTPFYGATVAITARDALREELMRSRSIVQHLEAMLGADIGGLDPEARNAALSPGQLETLKALHTERLSYGRLAETVVRLDLDALDDAAIQRMADRIGLALTGFILELGLNPNDLVVRTAARNLIDRARNATVEDLREYAGRSRDDDSRTGRRA